MMYYREASQNHTIWEELNDLSIIKILGSYYAHLKRPITSFGCLEEDARMLYCSVKHMIFLTLSITPTPSFTLCLTTCPFKEDLLCFFLSFSLC